MRAPDKSRMLVIGGSKTLADMTAPHELPVRPLS
jgi:hypothetical protein